MGSKKKKSADTNGKGITLGKKQLAKRIHALTARVTYLESSLAETEQRTGTLTSELTKLASSHDTAGTLKADLAAARADLSGMAQRLDGMEAAQSQDRQPAGGEAGIDTLEQIETRLSFLGGDLEQYRLEQSTLASKIEESKEHDGQWEQSLLHATERTDALNEREDQLEKALGATGDRLYELEKALDATGTRLDSIREENSAGEEKAAGLASEIGSLRESDGQRQQQLRDISERIEGVSEREEQLEKALGTTGDRLHGLGTVLDTTGDRLHDLGTSLDTTGARLRDLETARHTTGTTLGSMQKENRTREEKITGVQSGLRILAWSGAAALIALTAGTLMFVNKQQTDHRATIENELNLVQQRSDNSASDDDAKQIRIVAQEMVDLQAQVKTLNARFEALPQGDGETGSQALANRMVGYKQRQSQLTDRLNLLEQRFGNITDADQVGKLSVADAQEQVETPDAQVEALPQDDGETGSQVLITRMEGYEQRLSKHTGRLNLLEQQLGNIAAANRIVKLSEETAELHAAFATLNSQIDDLQQDESTTLDTSLADRLDAYDREQSRIMENLDDLGKRLARIENPISPQETEPEDKTDLWKTAREQRHFTVQLLGVRTHSYLLQFARRHRLLADSASLETVYRGRPWFVLFRGTYKTRSAATKALRTLPPELLISKPWVRRLPRTGNIKALE